MEVIKFIKENGVDALVDLGIKVTKHPVHPLYILNYEQWAEKFDPIVMECRGLVVDGCYNVLCRPMVRFFNYGEVEPRDFTNSLAFQKLDGTMICVWWNPYENKWSVSTRNSFGDAKTAWGNTFESIVRPLIDIDEGDKGHTFIFELVSPENRVLTPYSTTQLYHLTTIRNNDGKELMFKEPCAEYTIPVMYAFDSKEAIDNALAELPELDEGYVVRWPDGYRMKVKNPAYLALSKSKGVHYRNSGNGAMSQRRAMEVYFEGNADEYLSYFPEDAPLFRFRDQWEKLVKEAEDHAVGIEALNKRQIAETYGERWFACALFAARDGKHVRTFLNELPAAKKIKLLENTNDESHSN